MSFILTYLSWQLVLLSSQNVLTDLSHTKMQLETTAFDVQSFISDHAQDLSPNQSRQLLRLLNTTQKCFLDLQELVTTEADRLEALLQLEQGLGHQKVCLSCGVVLTLLLDQCEIVT